MENINIRVANNTDEIHVVVGGNDYYYDKPVAEKEAVLRSVMKFYGVDPDYCLDGIDFDEFKD